MSHHQAIARNVCKKFTAFTLAILLAAASSLTTFANNDTVNLRLSLPYGSATTGKVLIVGEKTAISLSSLLWYLDLQTYGKVGSNDIYFRNYDKTLDAFITPGSGQLTVNGVNKQMPFASFYHKNDLFVPLDFVCQELGYQLHWREANQTLYIQDPEQYQMALDFIAKSFAAVAVQKGVKTTINNQTKLRYYADNAVVTASGEMNTDLTTGNAFSYEDSTYSKPVSYFSDQMESTPLPRTEEYVTKNGIYSKSGNNPFVKDPPPPENISVLDMASKSVLTDWDLFIYSAYISTDGSGNTVIKSQTDVGLLLNVGFTFYSPNYAASLNWTNTYQTVTYDKDTCLPKKLDFRFNADYIPEPAAQEKLYLNYEHSYEFEFRDDIVITLPAGIE